MSFSVSYILDVSTLFLVEVFIMIFLSGVSSAKFLFWQILISMDSGSDVNVRRPLRQRRDGWRRMASKFLGCVNDLSVNHCQNRFDALDFLFGRSKIIISKGNKICQLPRRNCAFLSALARKPTAALGIKPQS